MHQGSAASPVITTSCTLYRRTTSAAGQGRRAGPPPCRAHRPRASSDPTRAAPRTVPTGSRDHGCRRFLPHAGGVRTPPQIFREDAGVRRTAWAGTEPGARWVGAVEVVLACSASSRLLFEVFAPPHRPPLSAALFFPWKAAAPFRALQISWSMLPPATTASGFSSSRRGPPARRWTTGSQERRPPPSLHARRIFAAG